MLFIAHFFEDNGIITVFALKVKNSKGAKFGHFAQKSLHNKRLQTCNYLKKRDILPFFDIGFVQNNKN